MEQVVIRNLSRSDARVVVQGDVWHLAAYAQKAVPEDVAGAFLKKFPQTVTSDSELQIPDMPNQPLVYLANMSGSPHAPKKVTVGKWDPKAGRNIPTEIDNPLAEPLTMREMFSLGVEPITIAERANGDEKNYGTPIGTVDVVIPPFSRAAVPELLASRILDRDALHPEGYRNWTIQSRPPQDGEPSLTSTLDDMRLYAELVDPEGCGDAALGIGPEKQYVGKVQEREEAKRKLWRALFFRLVDPAYNLPTVSEVRQLKELRKASK